MNGPQIIAWILGLASAFLAAKWQASARENENLKQKLSEKKAKLYADFVKLYMELINGGSNEKTTVQKIQKFTEEILLTGSNRVLLVYGDLMQTLFAANPNNNGNTKAMRILGELILAMRDDVGHSDWKRGLYWFDGLRPFLKDINDYIPPKYCDLRFTYDRNVDVVLPVVSDNANQLSGTNQQRP